MTVLFADIAGDPAQPPTVLLHGFGGHYGIWKQLRARLSPDIHTIAYDLPGHGGSLARRDSVSARKAAAAILDDLKERAAGQFHLVGHSLGGAIATLMALSEPNRIATLTLLAPGGYGETINEPALKQFGAARSPAELAAALQPMCGADFSPDQDGLEALAKVRALPGQAELLADLAAVIARGGRQGAIPRDAIAVLPMPVTVVWGEDDNVLSPDHARDLPPHFRLLRLAGAGHMLPEERADLIAGIIRGNLA